ncbi:hypothetical protein B9Z19DRAFT_1075595 [Tuber borchii]|uniref:Uncharacterized protein n=1 Tax=Tuber borchii TaxID=42251 RepID=A0A2T7A3E3_TUBBO|nr:hypothetical protein B9Z19DRAFT_1075595 [Tuber borchii]
MISPRIRQSRGTKVCRRPIYDANPRGFWCRSGKEGAGKARRPIEHIQHMRHRYLVPKDLLRANAREKTIISLHK